MKKLIYLIFFVIPSMVLAQRGITYQALILNPVVEELPGTDNQRTALTNKTICLRVGLKYQIEKKVKSCRTGGFRPDLNISND